jgi:hypothetical protein
MGKVICDRAYLCGIKRCSHKVEHYKKYVGRIIAFKCKNLKRRCSRTDKYVKCEDVKKIII